MKKSKKILLTFASLSLGLPISLPLIAASCDKKEKKEEVIDFSEFESLNKTYNEKLASLDTKLLSVTNESIKGSIQKFPTFSKETIKTKEQLIDTMKQLRVSSQLIDITTKYIDKIIASVDEPVSDDVEVNKAEVTQLTESYNLKVQKIKDLLISHGQEIIIKLLIEPFSKLIEKQPETDAQYGIKVSEMRTYNLMMDMMYEIFEISLQSL
ncbi:Uncharacterised protein [Metamycoplasma cloacale]|uniref:Uncharacterized protein n=1 Tax=Metamycoplasma cloacale TaxID=92401 RepID=A0A2Z4LM40_9BACT|nr:variable surface lipoprotein [Metamycoplasma cloacale]AWX42796.1 hypothetical protein DK849_01820 [Metamycoplasma cloacale]VEU79386.1 Uncharacterised protein [Metamycoplasma cloacale]